MIEPMVFGLIQAEIVEPAQSPAFDLENEVQKNFGEMLRMLLISYLNYGQALEDKLEAKNVFHMGMKLCFQYLPGGSEGYLFKKFYAKFSRVYKQVAEAIVASDSAFEEAESQLQRLPELLSLATFGQNQGRQRGELNIQESGSTKSPMDRQNLSFTIQDSNLAAEIGAPGANLIIQQRERVSSTSMPIMPQHESREELKERDDLIMAPPSQPKKSAVIQASQMFTQIDELPFVMADQTLEPENDTPEQNSS